MPKPDRHSLRLLTSPEAADKDVTSSVVLVPAGAIEQHGPHLPLGTDVILSSAVAYGVAELTDCVVSEPLAYGCSWHHSNFTGTVTLRTGTFVSLAFDICQSLSHSGFLPVLLNGHHGNKAPLQVALADLAEAGVKGYALSYFDLLADVVEEIIPGSESSVGHACALETSLITYLKPECVNPSNVPTGGTPPAYPDPHMFSSAPVSVVRPFEEINPTGVVGRPEKASAERGERLFSIAVSRCTEAVNEIRRQEQ